MGLGLLIFFLFLPAEICLSLLKSSETRQSPGQDRGYLPDSTPGLPTGRTVWNRIIKACARRFRPVSRGSPVSLGFVILGALPRDLCLGPWPGRVSPALKQTCGRGLAGSLPALQACCGLLLWQPASSDPHLPASGEGLRAVGRRGALEPSSGGIFISGFSSGLQRSRPGSRRQELPASFSATHSCPHFFPGPGSMWDGCGQRHRGPLLPTGVSPACPGGPWSQQLLQLWTGLAPSSWGVPPCPGWLSGWLCARLGLSV